MRSFWKAERCSGAIVKVKRRRPVLDETDRDNAQPLCGLMIRGSEDVNGDNQFHTGDRLDLVERACRQRCGEKTQAAVHDQEISARGGGCLVNAGFHALEHAEKRKRDTDLKENERGPTGFAPDARPEKR